MVLSVLLRRVGTWYVGRLRLAPILTKTMTSALIFGGADVGAQRLERDDPPGGADCRPPSGMIDARRMLCLAAWGGAQTIPCHYWYNLLDLAFVGEGVGTIAAKVAADQALFTPVMVFLFFTTMAVCNGQRLRDAAEAARDKLWPVLRVNWVIWPLIHVVTFGLVPLELRILWINVCMIFWTIFLSLKANQTAKVAPSSSLND